MTDIAFTSDFCNNYSHPASPTSLCLTSPRPRPTRPRVPYLMSSSPSSRVPKSQVPTHASRCPRPLVPVPLLHTAVKTILQFGWKKRRFNEKKLFSDRLPYRRIPFEDEIVFDLERQDRRIEMCYFCLPLHRETVRLVDRLNCSVRYRTYSYFEKGCRQKCARDDPER